MKLFAPVAMASAMLVSAHASAVDCKPTNVTLSDQAEVDGFQASQTATCDTVTGRLRINGGGAINNLDALSDLVAVNGSLQILDTSALIDLDGLSSLAGTVGGMSIQRNSALESLDALDNVSIVGGGVTIRNNPAMANIEGLSGLRQIAGNLVVRDMQLITDLKPLSSVSGAINGLTIRSNPVLTDVDGLLSITDVGANLDVRSNATLGNLRGLSNIQGVVNNLTVRGNGTLDDCNGIYQLVDTRDDGPTGPGTAPSPDVGGTISLNANLPNCNSVAAIIAAGPLVWDAASGDWANSANWYPQQVPGPADRPVIKNGGTATATAGTVEALDLNVGDIAFGGSGAFVGTGANIATVGDLLSASGQLDDLTMTTRRVDTDISVTTADSVVVGGDLGLSRMMGYAAIGDDLNGRLRANSISALSGVANMSVGGDLDVGMVISESNTGSDVTRVQRATYQPRASLTMTDIAALSIAGSMNIGVVAAVETAAGTTRGQHIVTSSAILQGVTATVGSVTRVGVVDQSAAFSGQTPTTRARSRISASMVLRSSALATPALEVGVIADGHTGSAVGTLELNPSYVNAGALNVGAEGSVTLNIEGLTRATAANIGQPELYAAIDASSAVIAGAVNVVFNFTPGDGDYDFDLLAAPTITLAPGASQNVQNLPAGFTVTSFDVQPGASGGSVYRLSISSDGTVDPNDPTDPNDPVVPPRPAAIKVPTMGVWPMAVLVLLVMGVAGHRSRRS